MSLLTEAEIARLRIVTVPLGSGLQRGELIALRWRDVALLEGTLTVRAVVVRGRIPKPQEPSVAARVPTRHGHVAALNEQWQETAYKTDDDLVLCHRELGTPLDPSKLTKRFLRPAIVTAGITNPFRAFHDLRHTAITMDATAGSPSAYVQMKAGHSNGAITERYVHTAAVMFPGAADKTEQRLSGGG
jgi:integrase